MTISEDPQLAFTGRRDAALVIAAALRAADDVWVDAPFAPVILQAARDRLAEISTAPLSLWLDDVFLLQTYSAALVTLAFGHHEVPREVVDAARRHAYRVGAELGDTAAGLRKDLLGKLDGLPKSRYVGSHDTYDNFRAPDVRKLLAWEKDGRKPMPGVATSYVEDPDLRCLFGRALRSAAAIVSADDATAERLLTATRELASPRPIGKYAAALITLAMDEGEYAARARGAAAIAQRQVQAPGLSELLPEYADELLTLAKNARRPVNHEALARAAEPRLATVPTQPDRILGR